MSALPTNPLSRLTPAQRYNNTYSASLSPFSYPEHATSVMEAVLSPAVQNMGTCNTGDLQCTSTSQVHAGMTNQSLDAAHTAALVGALSAPPSSQALTNSVGSVGGPWASAQHAARTVTTGSGQLRKYFRYHMQRLQTTANHVLFYVVDGSSVAHLAIVGTDVRLSGHFVYCTLPDFKDGPPVRCTNRAKVMEWLSALGATECADPDQVQVPAISQQQLDMLLTSDPMFTKPALDRDYSTWREEGGRLPDGRHFKNFFLVHSASGAERLVITAEDSHRRDRRYSYKAVPDLGGFTFENGQAVKEWLDFITGRTAGCTPTRPPGRARSSSSGAPRSKTAKHSHVLSLSSPSLSLIPQVPSTTMTTGSVGSMAMQLLDAGLKTAANNTCAIVPQQQRACLTTDTTCSKHALPPGSPTVFSSNTHSVFGVRLPLSLSVPLPNAPKASSTSPLLCVSPSTPLPGIVFPDQSATALLAIPMGVCTYHPPPASAPYTSPDILDAFYGDPVLLDWVTTAPEPSAVARVRLWCCWLRHAAHSDLLANIQPHELQHGTDVAERQQPQEAVQKVVEVIDCLQSEQINLRLLEATQALYIISKLQGHPCRAIADRAWQLSVSWRATAAAALSKTTAALQAAGNHFLP